MNFVKQIEGEDPVAVSGYYGKNYVISLLDDHNEIYSISILQDGNDAYLVAGVTNRYGNYVYAYKYKITNFTYGEIAEFLGQYVK